MALVLQVIKHFYGHLEVQGVKKKFHLFTLSSFLFVVVVVIVVASVIIYAPFEQKTDGKKYFLLPITCKHHHFICIPFHFFIKLHVAFIWTKFKICIKLLI